MKINPPIFVYHRIFEGSESIQFFEKQMNYLFRKGFRTISLGDAVDNWRKQKPQPRDCFVLTFDDGYADIYKYALPVLEKLQFSATIFVIPQLVENGDLNYLTWKQMRELVQSNFNIGSHTLTHPHLNHLEPKIITLELVESKKIIEDRLSLPVDLLAYPFGDSDQIVENIAKESCYRAACAVSRRQWSLYNLWRVPLEANESERTLYWKAIGGYLPYYKLHQESSIAKVFRVIKRNIKELLL